MGASVEQIRAAGVRGPDLAGIPDVVSQFGRANPGPEQPDGPRAPNRAGTGHRPAETDGRETKGFSCDEFNARADVQADKAILEGILTRLINGKYLDKDSPALTTPSGCHSADYIWPSKDVRSAFMKYLGDRLSLPNTGGEINEAALLVKLKKSLGVHPFLGGSVTTDINAIHAHVGAEGHWVEGHISFRAAAEIIDRLDAAAAQAQPRDPRAATALNIH
jgi:hypothetical protein